MFLDYCTKIQRRNSSNINCLNRIKRNGRRRAYYTESNTFRSRAVQVLRFLPTKVHTSTLLFRIRPWRFAHTGDISMSSFRHVDGWRMSGVFFILCHFARKLGSKEAQLSGVDLDVVRNLDIQVGAACSLRHQVFMYARYLLRWWMLYTSFLRHSPRHVPEGNLVSCIDWIQSSTVLVKWSGGGQLRLGRSYTSTICIPVF